jgi:hypothetical protein
MHPMSNSHHGSSGTVGLVAALAVAMPPAAAAGGDSHAQGRFHIDELGCQRDYDRRRVARLVQQVVLHDDRRANLSELRLDAGIEVDHVDVVTTNLHVSSLATSPVLREALSRAVCSPLPRLRLGENPERKTSAQSSDFS